MKRTRLLSAFVVLAVLGATIALASPAMAARRLHVHHGQSIQAAVARAHPGDTIVVHPGTYHQSVFVGKDHITLRGSGATRTIIAPPKHSSNPCWQQVGAGICVIGDVDFQTGEVHKPVVGARISGFRIRDFPAFGIITFGAERTVIHHNRALRNGEYGITSFASTGSSFLHNVATHAGEAGFYYGDTPSANGLIKGNITRRNFLGIFIRNASHGLITHNYVHDNCAGVFFLAGEPGPVGNWTLSRNLIRRNNKVCPASDEAPPISGIGVFVAGAHDLSLLHNHVLGNRPGGRSFASGGILLGSLGPVPRHNLVKGNLARRNRQFDIATDGSGSGNRFVANSCGRSRPASICN